MTTVNIHALLPKNVLTSRSSARSISDAINLELRRANSTYEINFKDIRALAPSFFDELLSVVEDGHEQASKPMSPLTITHPPSELSPKFHAVC
ncbi:MAG: hypothetical protein VCA17_14995 [Dehalococcoidia bacterium]